MVTLCQQVLNSQLDETIYVERKSELISFLRAFDTEVPLLELDVEQQRSTLVSAQTLRLQDIWQAYVHTDREETEQEWSTLTSCRPYSVKRERGVTIKGHF